MYTPMQLFATNADGKVISAASARKQSDYRCLECGGAVRVRGGFHRQNHFYHLFLSSSCRQSGKSMEHLQVQRYLENILTESELEKPFPAINRIADVVWEREKLVIEVQCSPIKAEEVRERNRDYRSLGYEVVWILHDHRYNGLRVSAAEKELRDQPHYFTNMDSEGKGVIYDQYDWVQGDKRIRKLPLLEVKLDQVQRETALFCGHSEIMRRIASRTVFFEGDLATRIAEGNAKEYLSMIASGDKETSVSIWQMFWNKAIARPYHIFFQLVLESCSK